MLQKSIILGVVVFGSSLLCEVRPSEAQTFWAKPEIRKKGEDFLHLIDFESPDSKSKRKLRCIESLPLQLEKIIESSTVFKGSVFIKVKGKISESKVLGTEQVDEVEILAIVILPENSSLKELTSKELIIDGEQKFTFQNQSDPFSPVP